MYLFVGCCARLKISAAAVALRALYRKYGTRRFVNVKKGLLPLTFAGGARAFCALA